MKASALMHMLLQAGWSEIRQQGHHRIFSHPAHPNLIAVPDLGDRSLKLGLLNDILREAGIRGRVKQAPPVIRWIASVVQKVRMSR